MRVSAIIPAFNEERTVGHVVRRLRQLPVHLEIIAVNDCSTDTTGDVLDRLGLAGEVDVVLHQAANQGKGAAVRRGISAASGDVIIVQDADLEYDPGDLPMMASIIASGRADAVFGSRFAGEGQRRLYSWHSVANKLVTRLSNLFTGLSLTDMETGYKMVRASLMKSLVLRSDRFGFEPEVTARLAQAGARIHEVPISYTARSYQDGKKIGWRDGVAALWYIVRYNVFDRAAAPAERSAPTAYTTSPRSMPSDRSGHEPTASDSSTGNGAS